MVSEEKIKRLRKEAETIFTHLKEINSELEEARNTEGNHWEKEKTKRRYKSPSGEEVEINLEFNKSASENAQIRYNRAKELEEELEMKKKIQGPLASAPKKPLTYQILNHLKKVNGDYPKSISYNLNNELSEIRDTCQVLEERGFLNRLSSGMLKRKKVKLKRSNETHQHHTYYELNKKGSHLLRYLDTEEGKKSFLFKHEVARRIAKRLSSNGPDYPRKTSRDLDLDLDKTRKIYKAMLVAGLVKRYEGQIIKGEERKLKPKDETHKKHTYYRTTKETDKILREIG